MFFCKTLIFLLFLFSALFLQSQSTHFSTGVLVAGGGTGGTVAGIQAARLGINTIIVEPTSMLGGMLTAAGVSCTDGNHILNSGIWQQFREALYQHYNTRNLATGWVSETCFEPHVGDSIFKAWASEEKKLRVLYGYTLTRVLKKGNSVTGAVFKNKESEIITIHATVTIDATELGDVLAKAGAAYDIGMDDGRTSGEKQAGRKNNIIQDITWAAVLKDYGTSPNKPISQPAGYRAANYYCCCSDAPCNGNAYKVDVQKMLDYGKLPGNKYMLNWPAHGNDAYLNAVEENNEARNKKYAAARNHTLGFIHFIQTQLGMKNIGLADDELDSGMAIIPYNREGRRIRGMVRFNINHISNPYAYTLYRTGIAVGDYPVDHHHGQYPGKVPVINFPKIPSFNIPMGALVPARVDGLVVCEKSISVSNIVNGSTRLQPAVMLTGQAAGVLACISIQEKKQIRNIPVRAVQEALLKLKCYIMPYADVTPDDLYWEAVQQVGATGILKGVGKPEGWENKTYFYPDSTITVQEFKTGLHDFYPAVMVSKKIRDTILTIRRAMQILLSEHLLNRPHSSRIISSDAFFDAISWSNTLHLQHFDVDRPVKRFELAVILAYYNQSFNKTAIDIKGKIKQTE